MTITIKVGPKMVEFAGIIGASVEDVSIWAEQQINNPPDHLRQVADSAEKRKEGIIEYMQFVIDQHYRPGIGINERIRKAIEAARIDLNV